MLNASKAIKYNENLVLVQNRKSKIHWNSQCYVYSISYITSNLPVLCKTIAILLSIYSFLFFWYRNEWLAPLVHARTSCVAIRCLLSFIIFEHPT